MKEQVDYYFNEEGLMVFTSEYHLKRGYCCKNECKHCPWGYRKSGSLKERESGESGSPKDRETESLKDRETEI